MGNLTDLQSSCRSYRQAQGGTLPGGRQLPHLFPESVSELSPVYWCQGHCKNGTGWGVAEENGSGNGGQTQPGWGKSICSLLHPLKPWPQDPTNLGVNLNSENESMDSEVSRVLSFGKEGKESLGKGLEWDFRRVRFGFWT